MKSTEKPIQVKDVRERDFYIIQRDLVRRAGRHIGPYCIAVYNCLLSHADENKESWPGLLTIADECGMSKMQVIRSLNVLVNFKMIRIERGRGISNKYFILDVKFWQLPEVVTVSDQLIEQPVTDSDQLNSQVVTVSDQLNEQPVTDSDQLGDKVVTDSDPKYIKNLKTRSISRASDIPECEKPAKKKLGVQVNYLDEISKTLSKYDQETKIAVQLFLDTVASHNKTGKMSDSRYLTLLCELSAVSATVSADAFRSALRKAVANQAYSVNYIKAILSAQSNAPQKQSAQGQPAANRKPKTHYECSKNGTWYRVIGEERIQISEDEVPPHVLSRHRGDRAPVVQDSPAAPLIAALSNQFKMPFKQEGHAHV